MRIVIGCLAGWLFRLAGPSSTVMCAKAGMNLLTGSSRPILPSSTSRIAAMPVLGLVIE